MAKKQIVPYVHEQISALAPIDGVSVGKDTPKEEWEIWFKDVASIEEKDAAKAWLNSFDPVVWEAQQEAAEAADKAIATQYENDQSRKDMVDRLKTASPAQIDTWLTNNVTNLAQARNVLGIILKLMRNKL